MTTPEPSSWPALAQGLSLGERLALNVTPQASDGGSEAAALATHWAHLLGSEDVLQRALASRGLKMAEVRPFLGPISAPSSPPDWVAYVPWRLEGARDAAPTDMTTLMLPRVLRPAVERVWEAVPPAHVARWSVAAQQEVVDQMAHRLAWLIGPAVAQHFRIWKQSAQGALFFQEQDRVANPVAFLDFLVRGGWSLLMRRLPALARWIGVSLMHWTAALAELCRRLADDRALAQQFPAVAEHPVMHAAWGLSDFHAEGRTVVALSWPGGTQLVYKPRPLATEAAWQRILAEAEQGGAPESAGRMVVVDRGTYGWVEFLHHLPCDNIDGIAKWYQRFGALLTLYAHLEGTDIHCENLLARGDEPHLIDLETLCCPRIQPTSTSFSWLIAMNRTGMVPSWTVGVDGTARDDSALGVPERAPGRAGFDTALTSTRWSNRPRLHDKDLPPGNYVAYIRKGVEACGRWLLENRKDLTRPNGLLRHLEGLEVRALQRDTSFYGELLHRLRHPLYLRSGAAWSVELEVLGRSMFGEDVPAFDREFDIPLGEVLADEIAALERGDVPYFRTSTQSTDLVRSDGVSPNWFTRPALEVCREGLAALDQETVQLQADYIGGAFAVRSITSQHTTTQTRGRQPTPSAKAYAGEPLAEAQRILDQLWRSAVMMADSRQWFGPDLLSDQDRAVWMPVGDDVYAGRAGIAVAMLAMGHVTGVTTWHDRGVELLRGLLQRRDTRLSPASQRLYALTVATRLGAKRAMQAALQQLVDEWPDVDVDDVSRADVLGGVAGAILALVAAHRCGANGALGHALELADYLMQRRVELPGGALGWLTHHNGMMSGFSHGAAGIALALARVGWLADRADLVDAAHTTVIHESRQYNLTLQEWPDLRSPSPDKGPVMTSWCHGAPGIGGGRLAMAREGQGGFIPPKDLERCLCVTRNAGMADVDHLCCGTAGRGLFLVRAGQQLHRADLLEEGQALLTQMIFDAAERGGYRLHDRIPLDLPSPGLFQGLAGIAWALMASVDSTLPDLLTFE